MRSLVSGVAAMLLIVAAAHGQTTFVCAFDPTSNGDQTSRGFYVTNYSGAALDTVTVEAWASTGGAYTLSMVAHNGTYNGPVIGSASANATLPATGPSLTPLVFHFNQAPVTPNSTIAFVQNVTSGPGSSVFINTGLAPCSNVTETEGTTAPLDTFRRASYGVILTGGVPVATSIPSLSTAMLILLALTLAAATVFVLRRR